MSDSAMRPNNTNILDVIMLDMLNGETTCKVSKSISKIRETIYGCNIPLGRRIDLILATNNLELSTGEWKHDKTSPPKCLQQQSKNSRMNKAILTYLLRLPYNEVESGHVFTVGMGWTGPMVYMFAIKQVNVYMYQSQFLLCLCPAILKSCYLLEKC